MSDFAVTTGAPVKELFIKMAVMAWDTQCIRVSKLLEELSNEQLAAEVAPGRNTGAWLIGHLIASTDGMFPLLGFGEKLYPHFEKTFMTEAYNPGAGLPAIDDLRKYWKEVNAKFSASIANTPAEDWFMKHNSVSAEDFAREPHRNKLNVLMNRTSHQSYHLGQLIFLKQKK